MTQAEQAQPAGRTFPFGAALAALAAATAIIVAGAFVTLVPSDPGSRAVTTAPAVTDGWLPAISAANAAQRAADATDGWATHYLVGAPSADSVTDGWAGRYLNGTSAADSVTDGWAGRYLNGTSAADSVTDGWAGRYLEPK